MGFCCCVHESGYETRRSRVFRPWPRVHVTKKRSGLSSAAGSARSADAVVCLSKQVLRLYLPRLCCLSYFQNTRVLTVESVSITESISSSDRTPSYVLSFSNEPSALRGAGTGGPQAAPLHNPEDLSDSRMPPVRLKTQLALAEERSAPCEPLRTRLPRSSEICLCRFPVVLVPSLASPVANSGQAVRLESTAKDRSVERSIQVTSSDSLQTPLPGEREQASVRSPADVNLDQAGSTGGNFPDNCQENLSTTVASLLPTAAYVLVGNPSIVVAPMLLSALHFCLTFPVHAVTAVQLQGKKSGQPRYSLSGSPAQFPPSDVSSSTQLPRWEGVGVRGRPHASFLRSIRMNPRHAEGTLEEVSPTDRLSRQRTCSGDSSAVIPDRKRQSNVGSLPGGGSILGNASTRRDRTFSESETRANSGSGAAQSAVRRPRVSASEVESGHEHGRTSSLASYHYSGNGGVPAPVLGSGNWPLIATADQRTTEQEAASLAADLGGCRIPGVRFGHSFVNAAGGSIGVGQQFFRISFVPRSSDAVSYGHLFAGVTLLKAEAATKGTASGDDCRQWTFPSRTPSDQHCNIRKSEPSPPLKRPLFLSLKQFSPTAASFPAGRELL